MWKRLMKRLAKEEIDDAYTLGLKAGLETGTKLARRCYDLGRLLGQVEDCNNKALPVIRINKN